MQPNIPKKGVNMELLEQLKRLENELEKQAIKKKEQCKILDIKYFTDITFDEIEEEQPVFLIEKEVNGEIKQELQMGDIVIADIGEDNTISMRNGSIAQELILLVKLRGVTPTSLRELEEVEMGREIRNTGKRVENKKQDMKKEETKQEELEESQAKAKSANAKDIEIDINKKITIDKTFADLVPEVKEKHLETVKIRRLDATNFEFYGETKEGEQVALESLKTTEGTNPTKEITRIGANGEVETDQVFMMVQNERGTNEQNGNEGFTVDIEAGVPKVAYYRRTRDNDYMTVPVNLKNTNQKRTDKEVQRVAEKTRNPGVSDEIEKAENILAKQEKTTLENIDDNPYNDTQETQANYEEVLIKEAAKRCKMSEEGFREVLEKERKEGESIETSIERAEEEINEQVVSPRGR